MSKKTPKEALAHPLAPLLFECFTLANAFEALAADARKDAQEAQAAVEAITADTGFNRLGREVYDDPTRLYSPAGWDEQLTRLYAAKEVITRCETLVNTLREEPLGVRNAVDSLIVWNAKAEPPKRKRQDGQ